MHRSITVINLLVHIVTFLPLDFCKSLWISCTGGIIVFLQWKPDHLIHLLKTALTLNYPRIKNTFHQCLYRFSCFAHNFRLTLSLPLRCAPQTHGFLSVTWLFFPATGPLCKLILDLKCPCHSEHFSYTHFCTDVCSSEKWLTVA